MLLFNLLENFIYFFRFRGKLFRPMLSRFPSMTCKRNVTGFPLEKKGVDSPNAYSKQILFNFVEKFHIFFRVQIVQKKIVLALLWSFGTNVLCFPDHSIILGNLLIYVLINILRSEIRCCSLEEHDCMQI